MDLMNELCSSLFLLALGSRVTSEILHESGEAQEVSDCKPRLWWQEWLEEVEGPQDLGRQDKVLIFEHGVNNFVCDEVGFQRRSQPGESWKIKWEVVMESLSSWFCIVYWIYLAQRQLTNQRYRIACYTDQGLVFNRVRPGLMVNLPLQWIA